MDMPIAGQDGLVGVPEEHLSEDDRTTVGHHWSAVLAFMGGEPGAASRVAEFEGQIIGGVSLVTDLDRIEELAASQQLNIDEFYDQG